MQVAEELHAREPLEVEPDTALGLWHPNGFLQEPDQLTTG
jgi:hypothetical protein